MQPEVKSKLVVRSPALIYDGAVTEQTDHFSSTTWLHGPRWSSSGELAIYDGQLSTCADLFTPRTAPLNAPNSHNLDWYLHVFLLVSHTYTIRKWLIKCEMDEEESFCRNRYFQNRDKVCRLITPSREISRKIFEDRFFKV